MTDWETGDGLTAHNNVYIHTQMHTFEMAPVKVP